MKLKKRFLFLLVLLNISCDLNETIEKFELDLIPVDSSTLIMINDLSKSIELINENKLIDNLFDKVELETKLKLLADRSIMSGVLSISPYGKNDYAFSFIGKIEAKDSLFKNLESNYSYQNQIIYTEESDEFVIYKTLVDNFLVSSDKDITIENIIRNFKSKSNFLSSDLLKISKTLNQNKPFNILLNSDNSIFKNSKLISLPFFPNYNYDWIGYDIENAKDEIKLSGALKINDSLNSKISILKNTYPKTILNDRLIPNSFKSFLTITYEDSERLVFNFKEYLKRNSISSENNSFSLLNIINEITLVNDQEDFIILDLSNLDSLSDYFEFTNTDNNNIKRVNTNSDFQSFLKFLNFNETVNFSAVVDNSIILTNSISQLRKILNSISIDDILDFNSNYQNLKKSKSSKQNFLWIVNTLDNFENFDSNEYPFISFSGLLSNEIAILDFDFSKNDKLNNSKDPFSEFFISNDYEISYNPIWVKNHSNNQYDFVFQDIENTLYYYSNNGEFLWKKELPNQIIGDIQQIDVYKNGRLQLLFRTIDNLYLLDRNGNEVDELTFKIESGIINNQVSVFDYEKNRNYRLVISSDSKIAMFDSRGKIVTGFKPESINSNIVQSPVHIRIKGKDYIVIQLQNGDLKILNRRGQERVRINDKIDFGFNQVFSYMDSFLTSDKLGNLIRISEDGEVEKINIGSDTNTFLSVFNNNLVHLNNNNLSIKGVNYKLPLGSYTKPKIFNYQGKILIGVTDLNEKNIYLFYDNAKLINGFPIKGTSPIDVIDSDNDGKIEILTKVDDFSLVSYEIDLDN
ncbi:MAG: hypothetical protein VW371_03575 [Bacteroidota bacterium]